MNELRKNIQDKIGYTDLVYGRINKKLKTNMGKNEIEKLVMRILTNNENEIDQIGKNYYIRDRQNKICLTINANTYRVITANKLN